MADVLNFPIPANPELAQIAYAMIRYIAEQQKLNDSVSEALKGQAAINDIQNERIKALEEGG